MEKYRRAGQVTNDNMAHAHCMLDTEIYKYTHSGCAILIACPLQQRLHERLSMLRYTYIACLAVFNEIEGNFIYMGPCIVNRI